MFFYWLMAEAGKMVKHLPGKRPGKSHSFIIGFGFAILGVVLSSLLSVKNTGLLSVIFTGIGLVGATEQLFTRHRELSWSGLKNPQVATNELVADLLSLLAGVSAAFAIYCLPIMNDEFLFRFSFQLDAVFLDHLGRGARFIDRFGSSLRTGVILLVLAGFLAAVYKEAGLSILISWIGSIWGVGIISILPGREEAAGMAHALFTAASIVTASTGFLTVGAVGLFLGRASLKYSMSSGEFRDVVRTSAVLGLAALGFMAFAAVMASLAGPLRAS